MKALVGAVLLTLAGALVAREGFDPFAPPDPFASESDFDPFAPADPFASEADVDPFAPPPPPDPSNPDRDTPKMIRVQVEFVEVEHEDYTRLMSRNADTSDATELRKKLAEMVEGDRAEVVETMMVVCRSGEKATAESIRELIYPTEYEPPGLPGSIHLKPSPQQIRQTVLRAFLRLPAAHTAFETRSVGSTFEIAPTVGVSGKVIDLRFAPQVLVLAGHEVYADYEALGGHRHQDKWPIFANLRVNTALTCRDGQYALATVLTPWDDEGQLDPSRKMMVLVKCDVLLVK